MEEYGRALTNAELEIIEDNLGDHIKWFDIIDDAISLHLKLPRKESKETI
jgi:hypothetical protein